MRYFCLHKHTDTLANTHTHTVALTSLGRQKSIYALSLRKNRQQNKKNQKISSENPNNFNVNAKRSDVALAKRVPLLPMPNPNPSRSPNPNVSYSRHSLSP